MDNTKVKKEILIIEDEQVIGMICYRLLTREGYNATLATDGDMAVKMLDKMKFDVFLLDIKLPGIDGLEVYQHISQKDPALSLKVIFMTGDTMSKNILEFVTTTGCQLLRKPFTIDELLTAVKKV